MFCLEYTATRCAIKSLQASAVAAPITHPSRGRIMVFYHVHAVNNWKWVVQDQLSKLIYSGLYNYATEVRGGSAAHRLALSPGCLPWQLWYFGTHPRYLPRQGSMHAAHSQALAAGKLFNGMIRH